MCLLLIVCTYAVNISLFLTVLFLFPLLYRPTIKQDPQVTRHALNCTVLFSPVGMAHTICHEHSHCKHKVEFGWSLDTCKFCSMLLAVSFNDKNVQFSQFFWSKVPVGMQGGDYTSFQWNSNNVFPPLPPLPSQADCKSGPIRLGRREWPLGDCLVAVFLSLRQLKPPKQTHNWLVLDNMMAMIFNKRFGSCSAPLCSHAAHPKDGSGKEVALVSNPSHRVAWYNSRLY